MFRLPRQDSPSLLAKFQAITISTQKEPETKMKDGATGSDCRGRKGAPYAPPMAGCAGLAVVTAILCCPRCGASSRRDGSGNTDRGHTAQTRRGPLAPGSLAHQPDAGEAGGPGGRKAAVPVGDGRESAGLHLKQWAAGPSAHISRSAHHSAPQNRSHSVYRRYSRAAVS